MKRLVALFTAAVMAVGIFAGSTVKPAKVNAASKKVIKLGVWASSPAESELLDNQIKEFEKLYPNIKIEKQVITGDYNQAMQVKIASKTEPDVFYLDVYQAPAYIAKKVVEPLDKYLDKNDVKDFEPSLLKGFSNGGKIYGLPKDYNTLVLFYNKDMFKEAGITKAPTTWKELEEVAKKLTKNGVKGLSLSIDAARFIPFMFQSGAKINDGDKPVFNTPQAAKGLDFYVSLLKKGYAATPKELGVGWNGDALAQKKAAMVIEGGWMIPFMKDAAPDVNYGIAKLPKGDKEGDLVFTVAYVMSSRSKNKTEAAEVIKFLTGRQALSMTAESGLAIPSRISMGSVYTAKYPERKPLVDMVKYSQVYQFGINSSKILDALNKACEKLYFNKVKDAKTALDQAIKEVK
ncbi:MAG: ABC transporter substrate-binding protein [Caloramator sp.]|nr:ABC transporter substrate-binding protein [Caloramator sp.]